MIPVGEQRIVLGPEFLEIGLQLGDFGVEFRHCRFLHPIVETFLRVGGEIQFPGDFVESGSEVAITPGKRLGETLGFRHLGVGQLLFFGQLLQAFHPRLVGLALLVALLAQSLHFVGKLRRVFPGL